MPIVGWFCSSVHGTASDAEVPASSSAPTAVIVKPF